MLGYIPPTVDLAAELEIYLTAMERSLPTPPPKTEESLIGALFNASWPAILIHEALKPLKQRLNIQEACHD